MKMILFEFDTYTPFVLVKLFYEAVTVLVDRFDKNEFDVNDVLYIMNRTRSELFYLHFPMEGCITEYNKLNSYFSASDFKNYMKIIKRDFGVSLLSNVKSIEKDHSFFKKLHELINSYFYILGEMRVEGIPEQMPTPPPPPPPSPKKRGRKPKVSKV